MSKSKKKQGISTEKQLFKLGRTIMYEVMSDYYRSLVLSHDYEKVLQYYDKSGYCTDSVDDNAMSAIEVIFDDVSIPDDVRRLLISITFKLIELCNASDRQSFYDNLHVLTDKFVKTYSKKQYFELSRKIIVSCQYFEYISFTFVVLDYVYYHEGMLVGEDDKSIIGRNFTVDVDCAEADIPSVMIHSLDNMDFNHGDNAKFLGNVIKYSSLSNSKIDKFYKSVGKDDLAAITDIFCAVSCYYRANCCFNKFLFDKYQNLTADDICRYAVISRVFSKEWDSFIPFMKILLYNAPSDLFSKRHCIIKDSDFPDIKVAFDREDPDNSPFYIDNFHISEFSAENGNYHLIYVSYCLNGLKRVIPVLIDNLQAFIGAYTVADMLALIAATVIYQVKDYVFGNADDKPEIYGLLQDFFRICGDSVPSEVKNKRQGTVGYHQNKEVHVDAFVRKLPKGQKASSEARALARAHRVELGDDKTIVSAYVRNKQD